MLPKLGTVVHNVCTSERVSLPAPRSFGITAGLSLEIETRPRRGEYLERFGNLGPVRWCNSPLPVWSPPEQFSAGISLTRQLLHASNR